MLNEHCVFRQSKIRMHGTNIKSDHETQILCTTILRRYLLEIVPWAI
jgi:hypothetical protein